MILPVLAIYAEQLDGSTPALMGLALGIYGVTQAAFQIPFGLMSDKFGRKPIIYFGLTIFIIGSLIAAIADTINGVIIGRALQGAGAIAAVVLALTSDLTRENQRAKAMAGIGMTIGLAFILALIAAPLLQSYIGVKGLFVLTALLAGLSLLLIWKVLPTPVQTHNLEVRAIPRKMLSLLKHPQLLRLDIGIFILHFVLTAMFVVVPIILLEQAELPSQEHWRVYVPALLGSVLFMLPMIILSSRKKLLMRIFRAAICLILFAQCLLMWRPLGVAGMTICLFFFFWGFNLLEAMLPSLVSRVAPAAGKGSAMGVYNTFQFMGVFLGGFLGGYIYGAAGVFAVFAVCGLLLVAWIWVVQTSPPLRLLDSLVVTLKAPVEGQLDEIQHDFEAVDGVEEVIIIADEKTVYLKVDKELLDQAALDAIST